MKSYKIINILLLRFIVFYLCLTGVASASLRSKVADGNKKYYKQKYEEALQEYRDAQIDSPESGELHFNVGNTQYKLEKYEEALKEYEQVTYSKNPLLESKAYYNQGNVLYRMGKLPESILMYKKCLDMNPDDEDAKYNIEFVQKKLKEMIDKNKDQAKQGQQGEQKKDKQKQQKGEEQKDKDKQAQEQKRKGEMSKEDAQRILNAVEDSEKKNLKQKQQSVPAQGFNVEEDW